MDTQLGDGPDAEDEWAVDVIRSHAGSSENSIFEVLWKSSDVTWMPYYQIRHLQALETYLELMGVTNASQLITGKGNPPQDDPQIRLGGMSLCPPFSPSPRLLSPTQQHLNFLHHFFVSITSHFLYLVDSSFPLSTQLTFQPSYLLSFLFSNFFVTTPLQPDNTVIIMPYHHPWLFCISDTLYFITQPGERTSLHVGQISNFLDFDRTLRAGLVITPTTNVPLGYNDFAMAFNSGRNLNDRREMSLIVTAADGTHHISRSRHPVNQHDLAITPEQCGFRVQQPVCETSTNPSALITREYATIATLQAVRR